MQIRRELAAQNPAAFLPDLAGSLTTLSDLLVTLDGDPGQAVTTWDDPGAGLPATSRAELLCHRSGWHRNRSDITAALADLGTAAALLDPDGPPDDPRAPAHARQHIRARLATFDPSDLSTVPFPSWATTPIPETVITLAHAWITADRPQRQRILTAPDMPTDHDLLRVLAAGYCDRPELRQWLDVAIDINTRGRDVVLAEMDAAHAATSSRSSGAGWISTPRRSRARSGRRTCPTCGRPQLPPTGAAHPWRPTLASRSPYSTPTPSRLCGQHGTAPRSS
ncbi:MAG: hypothetical protein JO063_04750 [Pseudonocardiales bacterium]|nr:hypothetical protein [Pseudonocardiales bacterium]MBV9029107.1 hypothetical protein [Pseudonocardiales bacterium]MBW0009418.1 hypothetical protein [Pseudonocardiales bacterium]